MKGKGILFLLGGLLIGVLLGALVLFGGGINASSTERRLPPTVGSPVRDFKLANLEGELQSLSGLKGKPVVVNFWATWCPPCKEEMPLLDSYAEAYRNEVVILGVNYAEEEPTVRAYITEANLKFPILLDEDGEVSNIYYVRNYPTTFFIDSDGVLRAQHIGLLTEETMSRYLKTIGIEP